MAETDVTATEIKSLNFSVIDFYSPPQDPDEKGRTYEKISISTREYYCTAKILRCHYTRDWWQMESCEELDETPIYMVDEYITSLLQKGYRLHLLDLYQILKKREPSTAVKEVTKIFMARLTRDLPYMEKIDKGSELFDLHRDISYISRLNGCEDEYSNFIRPYSWNTDFRTEKLLEFIKIKF